ncbi:Protein of unknown function [Actinacidiphila yanglinensis]|uniref:DUF3040 domain-containing protein n=1 Tax=Actinacidiphila yanglinensis TaxID=310779 RepID=A0A1H6EG10_9ACTN|nr:DUF3040 domain-containing protein [Actinacidiphila yanglinensis]SEG95774.1 Protein of unknown function [Actinacidiphila yanglinensis]
MGLTLREIRVLRDIELSLARDDPCLAQQLSHLTLTSATAEDERRAAESSPGDTARRFAKRCGALTLVLLAVSDLLLSTAVLYAAGAAALATLVSGLFARVVARGRRAAVRS